MRPNVSSLSTKVQNPPRHSTGASLPVAKPPRLHCLRLAAECFVPFNKRPKPAVFDGTVGAASAAMACGSPRTRPLSCRAFQNTLKPSLGACRLCPDSSTVLEGPAQQRPRRGHGQVGTAFQGVVGCLQLPPENVGGRLAAESFVPLNKRPKHSAARRPPTAQSICVLRPARTQPRRCPTAAST